MYIRFADHTQHFYATLLIVVDVSGNIHISCSSVSTSVLACIESHNIAIV